MSVACRGLTTMTRARAIEEPVVKVKGTWFCSNTIALLLLLLPIFMSRLRPLLPPPPPSPPPPPPPPPPPYTCFSSSKAPAIGSAAKNSAATSTGSISHNLLCALEPPLEFEGIEYARP